MSWQFAIVLHSLLSACNFIVSRSLGKSKIDYSYFTNVLAFVAVFLLGVSYIAYTDSTIDHSAALQAWPFLILGGALFAFKTFLVLRLFIYVPAAVGSIMSTFNLLAGVLFATVLLHEGLSGMQLLGLTSMVLAIYTIRKTSTTKEQKHNFTKGLSIAIFAALLLGIANVTEKYLLDQLNAPTYLLYGWGFQLLGAVVLALLYKKHMRIPTSRSYTYKTILYAVLAAISGGLFIYTLVGSNNASLTIALSGLKVIFAMILSYMVLKERQHMLTKTVSVLLTIVGVYLLMS